MFIHRSAFARPRDWDALVDGHTKLTFEIENLGKGPRAAAVQIL